MHRQLFGLQSMVSPHWRSFHILHTTLFDLRKRVLLEGEQLLHLFSDRHGGLLIDGGLRRSYSLPMVRRIIWA